MDIDKSKSELSLARKINDQLNEDGLELNKLECGELLYELGKCYRRKSPDKLSLLICAVLYNEAILRNVKNIDQVKNELKELCQHLLKMAGAKNPNFDVISVASECKLRFTEMRKSVQADLSKLVKVPEVMENCEPAKIKQFQESKINTMAVIQNKLTSEFVQTFCDLSAKIFQAIGNPPCRYSLVGSGYLARNKTTPYSDFKGMILLENEIEENENYDEILEYFRWFATLFSFVLINLGETPINSNDIKSFDSFKLKFKDQVTKPGIDLNNLGNFKMLENIELIKTSQEMTKYLCPDFVQKNVKGSSIDDALEIIDEIGTTRFIAGDREIHSQFLQLSHKALQSNHELYIKHFKEKLDREFIPFDVLYKCEDAGPEEKRNVRNMMCSLSSVYVNILARKYLCKDLTCFDILSTLKDKNLISENDERTLKYALALSSEVRLKSSFEDANKQNYLECNATEDKLQLLNEIGLQSAVDYFVIMSALQENLMMDEKKVCFDLKKVPVYLMALLVTDQQEAIEYIMRVEEMDGPELDEAVQLQEKGEKTQKHGNGIIAMTLLELVKKLNNSLSSADTENTSSIELPRTNVLITAVTDYLGLTEDQIFQLKLLYHNVTKKLDQVENSTDSVAHSSGNTETQHLPKKNDLDIIIKAVLGVMLCSGGQNDQSTTIKTEGKLFFKSLKQNLRSNAKQSNLDGQKRKKIPISRYLMECVNKSLPKSFKALNQEKREKFINTLDKYMLRKPIEKFFSTEKKNLKDPVSELRLWINILGLATDGIIGKVLIGLEIVNLRNESLEVIVDTIADFLVQFVNNPKK